MKTSRRGMGLTAAVSALPGLAVLAAWLPHRVDWGSGASFAAGALAAALPCLGFMLARARVHSAGAKFRSGLPTTENLLRVAVANAPLTLSLFDKDYRYLFATGKGLEARGVKEEDLLGQSALELYKNHPGAVDNLKRAMSGQSTQWSGTVSGRDLAAFNTPLRAPSGEVMGQVVISLDVTDRKRAEDQVRALNADLERKVTERTEQLEEAVRELEAFSYSVSHDLRAPLRHIGGFVELLVRKSSERLDDEGRRYLGIVGQSAKRMDQLISNLLSFSRMSRQELKKSRFNMADLMGQCMRELQPDLAGRDIRWEVADLPLAYGDQDLLRQVAANLLSNAAKFTKEREQARIEVGFLREGGQTVYFVRDNGAGFDMKYADKLFGVFQRLHDSSRFEGTGIGLANVRRVIGRHGGRAWAEGKPGEGATFYFSLPDQPKASEEEA